MLKTEEKIQNLKKEIPILLKSQAFSNLSRRNLKSVQNKRRWKRKERNLLSSWISKYY